jgi:hypothetical protein
MPRLFSLGQPFSGLTTFYACASHENVLQVIDFHLSCLKPWLNGSEVRKWPNPGTIFTLMGDSKVMNVFPVSPRCLLPPARRSGQLPQNPAFAGNTIRRSMAKTANGSFCVPLLLLRPGAKGSRNIDRESHSAEPNKYFGEIRSSLSERALGYLQVLRLRPIGMSSTVVELACRPGAPKFGIVPRNSQPGLMILE